MDQLSESGQLNGALARWAGSSCPDCGAKLCDHGVLCAVALGLKDRPRCLECAARGLDRDPGEMRRHLGRWLAGKDCYKKAWVRAEPGHCGLPCSLQGLLAADGAAEGADDGDSEGDEPEGALSAGIFMDPVAPRGGEEGSPSLVHDFGDMGCGDLVLELRRILRDLEPGTRVRVLATDPGAPQDIPAWVRMTGHTLLGASHPVYDLRKRSDA